MPQEALAAGIHRSVPESLVREVEEAVEGPYLALMVYGSQARGSADRESDVDVLAVVDKGAGSYSVGRVAVTAYTPAHLHAMAQASSLFVLHLRTEGVVLSDEFGVLARALATYVPISDFESHRQQIRAAAPALQVHPELFLTHGQALGRLGVYLLRTALYLDVADAGTPEFDIKTVAALRGEADVVRACDLRRASHFDPGDLELLGRALHTVLGLSRTHPMMTAEQLQTQAMSLAESSPHASALLVNVLFGSGDLDYVGVALAPW